MSAADPRPVALLARELPEVSSTGYPEPFRALVAGRHRRRLGEPFGLTQFGVNLCRLEPGAATAQRHWHAREDELVYVLEGEVVLVTDAGEMVLGPGTVAGFPAGRPDGHHLVARSDRGRAPARDRDPFGRAGNGRLPGRRSPLRGGARLAAPGRYTVGGAAPPSLTRPAPGRT